MADRAISELTAASSVGANDLFVLEQNNTAKKLQGQTLLTYLGSLWESYGGITDVTQYYAVSDNDTTAPSTWYTTMQSMTATDRYLWSYMTVTYATEETQDTTPCIIGVWGDKGDTWYTHIKYASSYPTQDSDMGDTPDAYVGIYTGTDASAPEHYTDYDWYGWKGIQGDTGTSITSITKTGTSGDVDTYTITFSNNTSTTFTVTNGSNIQSISKSATNGLVDTYTVLLTSGETTQFTVTNAKSITSVQMVSGNHSAGSTDIYQINFNNGDTATFSVYNGANGTGAVSTVAGIGVEGANGNVPLILIGNGAPTTATIGQTNQLYFDTSGSVLYICLGESGGTYSWAGAGITVDSAMSTSSTNPVQNAVISSKVGTGSFNTTATDCVGAINEHDVEIGDVSTLTTTATTLADAVNELDADIGTINSGKVSKTGDTMTGDLTANGAYFEAKSTNLTSNTTVGSATGGNSRVYLRDSNGTAIGILYPYFRSDGKQGVRLLCDRFVNSTEYVNSVELGIDSSANRYVDLGYAQSAWLDALGLGSTTTASTISNIISAASGATITSAYYAQWGKVAQISFTFKYSSAISTTSVTVGTLVSGKRPALSADIIASTGRLFGTINDSGVVTARVAYGISDLSANSEITMRALYLLP